MRIFLNGSLFETEDSITVFRLLEEFAIAPAGIAVEVNRVIISKSEHDGTVLKENDRVEIVRMTGGG